MALVSLVGLDRQLSAFKTRRDDELENLEDAADNVKFHSRICLPPFSQPVETLAHLKQQDEHGRPLNLNFNKGTTTCAFKYQGGVCICVDSRATGGSFIGSGTVKKVIVVNDFLLGTMAGGAADCTYWLRILSERCRMYELRNKERISVAAASKLLANILYTYKGMGISMGTIIIGYDKRGPGLYYVDDQGNRVTGNLFSCGSGSPFALGVLDSNYRYDMTDEEAYELGRRAITAATYRDQASGGIVRCYHMKPTGWTHIGDTDCMDLYYKYKEENESRWAAGAPASTSTH
ncbi:proteasome subunit beta type-5-like [Tropilaelaps mercedesae]|uniref:Proteasome subunit beta n=1 Tax=Tropilaelaps mercedesae TaxID=418985 RepID=A0A1V9WY34_9ACAR|nr:proteasome subunit beta type-5-like [Tropilaelaps mercedesae]